MESIRARELLAFSSSQPSLIGVDASLRDAVAMLVEDRNTREVYVVDDEQRFVGVLTLRRLARGVFFHDVPDKSSVTNLLDLISAQRAEDIALKKAAYVGEEDTLAHVMDTMFRFDLHEVPVVDDDRVIVGCLNLLDILAAWYDGRLGAPRG